MGPIKEVHRARDWGQLCIAASPNSGGFLPMDAPVLSMLACEKMDFAPLKSRQGDTLVSMSGVGTHFAAHNLERPGRANSDQPNTVSKDILNER